jgi:hypothetical protein
LETFETGIIRECVFRGRGRSEATSDEVCIYLTVSQHFPSLRFPLLSSRRLAFKKKKSPNRADGVEYLPSKCEALSSNPSTTKKKKKNLQMLAVVGL